MEWLKNGTIPNTLLTYWNGFIVLGTVPILIIIYSAVLTCQFYDWTEFPTLNEILKKHGADEEKQLGQAQFALVLQAILQDLADALAKNHIVIIQNIKISNGSKLIKVTGALRFFFLRKVIGCWVAMPSSGCEY